MLGRLSTVALAALLAAVGLGQLAPTAAAHCPDGAEATVVGGISTCPYNEDLEETVDRLNEASEDRVWVLVKDLGFHPPVVDVADGGTVTFVWGDIERNEVHDPQSSGVDGASNCQNPWADPLNCTPQAPGVCFRLEEGLMDEPGDTYSIQFQATDDAVTVSETPYGDAPVLGGPPFSPAHRECPDGTTVAGPEDDTLTIPYHCGIHGGANTQETIMRGAVVLHR